VRYPIEDIAILCRSFDAFFHCDAVQGYVRENINVIKHSISSLVISPHKFYGPKGIGILALGDELTATPFSPVYVGGEQEQGLRPGTVDLPLIVGATEAMRLHELNRREFLKHLNDCQSTFIEGLSSDKNMWNWTVPPSDKVPGLINLWFKNTNAQALIQKIPEICISRGATCSTAGEQHSHIPQLLGYPTEVSANVLRISFGHQCTVASCKEAAQHLINAAIKS
jgi:cysteine desulfurase